MRKWTLCAALVAAGAHAARGETLRGPVDMFWGEKNDQLVAHLVDGVRVDAGVANGKLTLIGFAIVVEPSMMDGCCTVKAGTPLIGVDGQNLGQAVAELLTEAASTDEKTHKLTTYVMGKVPAKAVRADTSVEYALAQIIDAKKGPLARADLDDHLKAFAYEPWIGDGPMESYYIVDVPYPSGGRIFVFFYNGTLAVVLHPRKLPLKTPRPTKISP